MAGKSKSGFGFKSGFSHFSQIQRIWIWIGFVHFCLAKVLWTGQTKNCILSVDPSVCVPCLVRHLRLTGMLPVTCLFVYDLVVLSSSSPCQKIVQHAPLLWGRGAYIIPALIVSTVLCCSSPAAAYTSVTGGFWHHMITARHLLLHIGLYILLSSSYFQVLGM